MDLALNNLQRLICHKTQTNKPMNKQNLSYLMAYKTIPFTLYSGYYRVRLSLSTGKSITSG